MKGLFTLALLLFSMASPAQPPLAIIPFAIEKNCIYVYCNVNGTDSIKFLFDTGADGAVINKRSLNKLKLKIDGQSKNVGSNGSNTVAQSNGNTIYTGGIVHPDITLTIIPYETQDFDGVLGTSLMTGSVIEIDYNRKELRFYARESYQHDLSGYDKLKIHFVNNYPAVESAVIIKGRKYKGLFGLDSGADDVLTIAAPFASKNELLHKMTKIGAAGFQGSDGSSYEMPVVLAPELSIGGKFFYRLPVSLSTAKSGIDATNEMAGFYGNNFLKRFNIVLNLKDGLIYLQPNGHLYTPFLE